MTRGLYQLIVRMHPPTFRRRFGDEMMSIFDEAVGQHGFVLMLDGLISCARQWLLRTSFWKLPLALFGAFVQVFVFGIPIKSQHYSTRNMQAVTPSVEQLMFFGLALMCTLFIVMMFLICWNIQLERRRSTHYQTFGPRSAFRLRVLRGRR
jgi:hypothetical protein